jgi:hypothetical protein
VLAVVVVPFVLVGWQCRRGDIEQEHRGRREQRAGEHGAQQSV